MLKLLATTLLLSSLVSANENAKLEQFLSGKFKQNPAILTLDVRVVDKSPIPNMSGWESVFIMIEATLKSKPVNKHIKQKVLWFTNGEVITKELTNIHTGESLQDLVSPSFKEEFYTEHNFLYGNKDAKHKVVIFSDPLCPYCIRYVPKAIEQMKKEPEKFAVYYYHLPLESLHPAAVALSQAAIAATELKGKKDVVVKMYGIQLDAKETDLTKILAAFNKRLDTNIKVSDLRNPRVQKIYKNDLRIAEELMVNGTPTVFFDGKMDRSKRMYEKVQ